MSNQTEIMFDGGVPMLDGTWYDPKTGNSITIRDTFFEDNNLVIMTTDGRKIPYTQMERYIKSDKPIPKQPKVDPNILKNSRKELAEPATWDDLILDEDKDILGNNNDLLTRGLDTLKPNNPPIVKKEENVEDQILEKALKRWDDDLEATITIKWGAKKSTLENLMDMFGFTEEDFAKYLLKKVKNIDLEEPMKNAVKQILN